MNRGRGASQPRAVVRGRTRRPPVRRVLPRDESESASESDCSSASSAPSISEADEMALMTHPQIAQLRADLEQKTARVDRLQAFYENLVDHDHGEGVSEITHFDEEDLEVTRRLLSQAESARSSAQHALTTFEHRVLDLLHSAQRRKDILTKADRDLRVFQEEHELCAHFAEKQAALEKKIAAITQTVLAPSARSHAARR